MDPEHWLRIRIRDPVPVWPLYPGWGKNLDPDAESGINIPAYLSERFETVFKVKNTTILWCGSDSGIWIFVLGVATSKPNGLREIKCFKHIADYFLTKACLMVPLQCISYLLTDQADKKCIEVVSPFHEPFFLESASIWKGPNHEIFVAELFTQSKRAWVDVWN